MPLRQGVHASILVFASAPGRRATDLPARGDHQHFGGFQPSPGAESGGADSFNGQAAIPAAESPTGRAGGIRRCSETATASNAASMI